MEGMPAGGRTWKTLLSWFLGAALLIAVVGAAAHLSEGEKFISLAGRADPWWFALAVLLQAGVYLPMGWIWSASGRRGGGSFSLWEGYKLSLARVFVNQTVPSMGVGGIILSETVMERRAVPRPAALAAVVLHTVSYYAAYVLAFGAALWIVAADGRSAAWALPAVILFALFGSALAWGVLSLSGKNGETSTRFPLVRRTLDLMREADPRMTRSPSLLSGAVAAQAVVVLMDAMTLWALVRSVGAAVSPAEVFAGFMLSTLVRTVGFMPGGLGTFEAASVVALKMADVDISAALAATLLFRGLNFWLPMLPGYWFSRRAGDTLPPQPSIADLGAYWTIETGELSARLSSGPGGLSSEEAARRLGEVGPNALVESRPLSRAAVLGDQFRGPMVLLLVFAAAVSAFTGEWLDAVIVSSVVMASVWVGYSREYDARSAAAALGRKVRTRASALRDGRVRRVPVEEVVPGDVVLLSAGGLVPGDGVLLESKGLFAGEGLLTGESFPSEKKAGPVGVSAPLAARTNCVFMGTSVRSGTGKALIVRTRGGTEVGDVARRLSLRPPEAEFDRGLRRFGGLMAGAMLVLVVGVFAIHVVRGRPPVETLLFSVALAVGLAPELLPAILTLSLARGARMMAAQGVLVRRLHAIENLGSMDVFCTDKTGTLTEGKVELEGAYGADGGRSEDVLEMAALVAALEGGPADPMDDAILAVRKPDLSRLHKVAEIPFDAVRKRAGVVVRMPAGERLVVLGAFRQVLGVCAPTAHQRKAEEAYEAWGRRGVRVLAVAARDMPEKPSYGREDERGLVFEGFLTFFDRTKAGAAEAAASLAGLGVSVKMITGDNRLVARQVAELVGLRHGRVLTGSDLDALQGEALWRAAEDTDVFAEVDPRQKERIVLALKKMGHVVGFLGDGVNDAPAMHAADASLSVESAVDAAREAADFVLLEKSLDVIRRGIEEGRRTFANTHKYILTTTSANLGNMISMAAASLFLPFLPLTAGQILLNNFLSDLPAVGLADDAVDPESVRRPRRWDMGFIGRFMVEFGLLSSLFDLLAFAVLLGYFQVGTAVFRTGWFTASLLTELAVALVVRTRRPFWRSRPGGLLLWSSAGVAGLALVLHRLPGAGILGFTPLPPGLTAALCGIVALYVGAVELMKRRFYGVESDFR